MSDTQADATANEGAVATGLKGLLSRRRRALKTDDMGGALGDVVAPPDDQGAFGSSLRLAAAFLNSNLFRATL